MGVARRFVGPLEDRWFRALEHGFKLRLEVEVLRVRRTNASIRPWRVWNINDELYGD